MTRIALPACRAYYPGGSRWVLVSVASPSRAAFPESQAGRHPRRHFRGLLRLHSRYGPLDRSTAQRRPLSQGFGAAGYPAGPLASYQIKPTTIWVEPSSTGDARRLGALRFQYLSTTLHLMNKCGIIDSPRYPVAAGARPLEQGGNIKIVARRDPVTSATTCGLVHRKALAMGAPARSPSGRPSYGVCHPP
jgi:hypothetical protein